MVNKRKYLPGRTKQGQTFNIKVNQRMNTKKMKWWKLYISRGRDKDILTHNQYRYR